MAAPNDPGIWIDPEGDARYFCLECMAWHRVDPPGVSWDDSPLKAYEKRKFARRYEAMGEQAEMEALLLDAEIQEFFLSSEAVALEIAAERNRP